MASADHASFGRGTGPQVFGSGRGADRPVPGFGFGADSVGRGRGGGSSGRNGSGFGAGRDAAGFGLRSAPYGNVPFGNVRGGGRGVYGPDAPLGSGRGGRRQAVYGSFPTITGPSSVDQSQMRPSPLASTPIRPPPGLLPTPSPPHAQSHSPDLAAKDVQIATLHKEIESLNAELRTMKVRCASCNGFGHSTYCGSSGYGGCWQLVSNPDNRLSEWSWRAYCADLAPTPPPPSSFSPHILPSPINPLPGPNDFVGYACIPSEIMAAMHSSPSIPLSVTVTPAPHSTSALILALPPPPPPPPLLLAPDAVHTHAASHVDPSHAASHVDPTHSASHVDPPMHDSDLDAQLAFARRALQDQNKRDELHSLNSQLHNDGDAAGRRARSAPAGDHVIVPPDPHNHTPENVGKWAFILHPKPIWNAPLVKDLLGVDAAARKVMLSALRLHFGNAAVTKAIVDAISTGAPHEIGKCLTKLQLAPENFRHIVDAPSS